MTYLACTCWMLCCRSTTRCSTSSSCWYILHTHSCRMHTYSCSSVFFAKMPFASAPVLNFLYTSLPSSAFPSPSRFCSALLLSSRCAGNYGHAMLLRRIRTIAVTLCFPRCLGSDERQQSPFCCFAACPPGNLVLLDDLTCRTVLLDIAGFACPWYSEYAS
jgi:hypothetical protein